LRDAAPSYPPELRDRHVEVWWNLFAIADLAGEDWPQAAREAALALHVGNEEESSYSVGVLLLAHIERAFDEAETDRLPTARLLDLLASNEEGPWGKWWGAELNRDGPPRAAAADLARKLKAFPKPDSKPIKPRVIKMPDGTTARGYHRDDFEAAWVAYLGFGSPHVTDVTDVTPLASTVTSVTSVTSLHPNGQGDLDPQAEFIRSWNADVYEQAREERARKAEAQTEDDGEVEDDPALWEEER
jgi:hypothetical protein